MKGSHWFIIFIVAFLVIMFAVEYHLPKKFVWTPTFGHYDDQPFGCAVFDSLLSASLPNGYTLSKKTFYQLEEEDTLHSRGILAVAHDMALTDIDVKSLLKMAERGNKVMLASTMFSRYLKDTLNFESYRFYSGWEIRQSILRERSISTLSFVPPIFGAIRCREKSWRGKRFM